MAGFSAIRGQDRVPVWWGLSSVDGVTPVMIAIDSATGSVEFEIGTSTSSVMAHLPQTLPRDDNRIPCIGGVSNADSSVIIPLSVNPATGAILAQII